MPIKRSELDSFLPAQETALLLDVRSPAEYQQAHIPGALSLPLFTNEERAVVGTLYKQNSREEAIKAGLDFFGPKMRAMVEDVEKLADDCWRLTATTSATEQRPTTNVFLYCWRGGMRSAAVAWLLDLYGFKVTVLAGGYKAFRNRVLQTQQQTHRLKLLGGYTGSGKTGLLQQLARQGETVIDLEALAHHKGSAFGNIGLPPQPTQEMFENRLSCALWKAGKSSSQPGPETAPQSIWVEDESQRIGLINIPQPFWQQMRQSPLFFLDIPFEERLDNLVAEYGTLDKERMIDAIERIAKRLGGLEAKNAIRYLQEDNTYECFRILLRYYDKHYLKGLHNREGLTGLLTNVPCKKVGVENASLVSQAQAAAYAGTH